jgi:hypothetical protein
MQVSLLTHGPVSLATMVSEPRSHLLAAGPGGQATIIFFILAADADAWACHLCVKSFVTNLALYLTTSLFSFRFQTKQIYIQ